MATPALLAGCGASGTWGANFLLRVAGRAGDESVEGQTVFRTEWTTNAIVINGSRYTSLGQGEAVILPAGSSRSFFGLVTHPITTPGFHSRRVASLFLPHVPERLLSSEAQRNGTFFEYLIGSRQKIAVPRESWPVITRFADIQDPKTVAIIPAAEMGDGGGATFQITEVTVEVTDKPLTQEIERVLPWLTQWRGNLGGTGDANTNSLAESISRENFIMTEITDAGH